MVVTRLKEGPPGRREHLCWATLSYGPEVFRVQFVRQDLAQLFFAGRSVFPLRLDLKFTNS
jgi:hypothetical protein